VPKKLLPDIDEKIVAEIGRHPAGATVAKLARAFARHSSRRTLQRRLGDLAGAHRIVVEGAGRATRYRLAAIVGQVSAVERPDIAQATGEVYIPVSTEGSRLRELVRRPVMQRTPVGYRRDFLLDYRPNETSYLPGETRARLRALGETPFAKRPAGTHARDVLSRLLIDLSWASSRLEGNTYSRLDTERLIEHGEAAAGKDARETQMILNHKRAIEFLVEDADAIAFDAFTFLNLHALLSENLLADPAASGRLRARVVEISGTVFHPLAIPQQIEEFFRVVLQKAAAIVDPFEQAFFLMVHIPYLQAFEDVNKRVSRLGANIPLLKHNLCPLSFIDVPERAYVEGTLAVYELTGVGLLADVFTWAYERSCQRYRAVADSLPPPDPFRRRYREALTDVIGEIVRKGRLAEPLIVERESKKLIPVEDRKRFVEMVIGDLKGLHEGNIARYRLRLSEFHGWKAKQEGVFRASR